MGADHIKEPLAETPPFRGADAADVQHLHPVHGAGAGDLPKRLVAEDHEGREVSLVGNLAAELAELLEWV